MKTIKPILLIKNDIVEVYNQIIDYFYAVLYKPLMDLYNDINQDNVIIKLNAINNRIIKALKDGTIYYKEGKLYGSFKDAKLVKELEKIGKYHKNGKFFKLETTDPEIINITLKHKAKIKDTIGYIDTFLDDFSQNIEQSVNFADVDYTKTINNYQKQILVNFNKLGIIPTLTEQEVKKLNENYVDNTKLSIKKWLPKDIKALRQQLVREVLEKGTSTKDIAKVIYNHFERDKSRALFLARQESSLINMEYSKNRYLNMGIKRFMWQTAEDEKVRNYPFNNLSGGNHKYLNGKVFEINNPPIVNLITGERGLPGKMQNCRCLMLPVID